MLLFIQISHIDKQRYPKFAKECDSWSDKLFLDKACLTIEERLRKPHYYLSAKMFVSQKERYLPMPDYDKSTATEVVLTLPGTVIDENYSLLLLENKNLSLTDAVLLDSVQKGKRISPEAIAMLRKRKLIEGRLPHIFIAKDIAQVTDQKIEYSKHKGLDDKKCEALLLDSLKDHGSLTKPEIVHLLWDVLPDQLDDKQKEYKINNLLRKLRKEGKISNTTIAGNKSTWALVNG